MILSMAQTKGGVGKSTVALLLAFSRIFAKHFSQIALVELDRQRTLKDFFEPRDPRKIKKDKVDFFYLAESSDREVEETLIKLADSHDLIIMDIPGESVRKFATSLALNISSIVILPMSDSVNDEKAFTRNLLPAIKPYWDKVPFWVLPNFIHQQTKPVNVQNYFRAWLPEEIHCLGQYLSYRGPVYRGFNEDGSTLLDYARSVKNNKKLFEPARAAAREVELIAQEIIKIIKG
ncbi:MAG: division plane positioning ATPase MipZ [Thermodesulfobacteriota bacterium]